MSVLIGDRLSAFMRESRITSSSLARKTGLSDDFVRALQTGFIEAPQEFISKICEILNITAESLKLVNDWGKIQSRGYLDEFARKMGLSIDQKILLAIEAGKPSRTSSAILMESTWNSIYNRLISTTLPFPLLVNESPAEETSSSEFRLSSSEGVTIVDVRANEGLADVDQGSCGRCGALVSVFTYQCPNCHQRTPGLMYDL